MKYLHLFFIVICFLFSSFAVYMAYNYSKGYCPSGSCVRGANITGVVDSDKVINESLALQNVQQQVKEQNSKLQQEFEKELERFQPPRNEFDLLSEEAKQEKTEQFNKYAIKARDDYTKRMSALEESYRDAVDSIFSKIKKLTKQIAEDSKVGLVLFISKKNQVLYSMDGIDLSDVVLKSINKEIPEFALKAVR
ncbi:MAG: OmpH family outer membrane protein [Wolbachia sp.]|nr:OmpH family outer membrane protein [Wolbachia sp.]MDD9336139.1 OmpH family outer membrane protein [Wolbachia sp.]